MGHVLKTLGFFEILKVHFQPMFSQPRRYFLHGPLHTKLIFIPEIHFGTVDAVQDFEDPNGDELPRGSASLPVRRLGIVVIYKQMHELLSQPGIASEPRFDKVSQVFFDHVTRTQDC